VRAHFFVVVAFSLPLPRRAFLSKPELPPGKAGVKKAPRLCGVFGAQKKKRRAATARLVFQ
jgi:hypothetical protein